MRAEFLKIALTTLIVFSFCTSEDLSFAPLYLSLSTQHSALLPLSLSSLVAVSNSCRSLRWRRYLLPSTSIDLHLSLSHFFLLPSLTFFHFLSFENLGIYMK
jgi:hypothetical protein